MLKKGLYIIIIVAVTAIALVLINQNIFEKNVEIRKISNPILPRAAATEIMVYDLDKIRSARQVETKGNIDDLEAVYKNYTKEASGDNMIEAWSKVNPEDKAKFSKGLKAEIEKSREYLKINPDDKKARSKLVISEMMDKLISNNFNCKFKGHQ